MIGLWAILLIKSKTGVESIVAKLLLSEQRREKDTFPDVFTVFRVCAIHRGRECPLAWVGCIYAKKFQKLL
jgi:hypothetical protein